MHAQKWQGLFYRVKWLVGGWQTSKAPEKGVGHQKVKQRLSCLPNMLGSRFIRFCRDCERNQSPKNEKKPLERSFYVVNNFNISKIFTIFLLIEIAFLIRLKYRFNFDYLSEKLRKQMFTKCFTWPISAMHTYGVFAYINLFMVVCVWFRCGYQLYPFTLCPIITTGAEMTGLHSCQMHN